ncbi:unnamed protein product [Rotaria sp. Silwood2]|nr:unnamed protein product [Rotaria sp. Silwood2]
MNQSDINRFDLPNEILFAILKKVDNVDVLYSLFGIKNKRLDILVQDGVFTNNLNFVTTSSITDVNILLILNIRHAHQLHERLRRYYSSVFSSTSKLKCELRTTTTMLVFITLFTVLVVFPKNPFFIASGINKGFFLLYSHLSDIWDVTLIGSSFITFIMYCSMFQQFHMEMYKLFLPQCLRKNIILKQITIKKISELV